MTVYSFDVCIVFLHIFILFLQINFMLTLFDLIMYSCVMNICWCRHVVLPKEIAALVPKSHLMSDTEWRGIGGQQSEGWVHYMVHEPGE